MDCFLSIANACVNLRSGKTNNNLLGRIVMKYKSTLPIALASLLLTTNAYAENVSSEETNKEKHNVGKFSVHAGLTYGGDDLSTLEYENGDKIDISAGGLALLGAGFNINVTDAISVKLNGSYHFDMASADNGDTSFSRFEFEVIPYYHINENVRIGAGIAYHTGIEYSSDFDVDVEFDSTAGFIVSGDYQLDNSMGKIEVRYVSVDYTANKLGNYSLDGLDVPSIDGNHFGILYHWVF